MMASDKSISTLVPPNVVEETRGQLGGQDVIVTLWHDLVSGAFFVTAYELRRSFRIHRIARDRADAQAEFAETVARYSSAGFAFAASTLSGPQRERLTRHLTDHHAFQAERAAIANA